MTSSDACRYWLSALLETAPADRGHVESLLAALYSAAGRPAPRHVIWHASPLAALWTFGALSEDSGPMTQTFLQQVRQRRDSLAHLESVQAGLQSSLGYKSFADVRRAVGRWQSPFVDPMGCLQTRLQTERTTYLFDTAGMEGMQGHLTTLHPDMLPLQAAEREVFGFHGDGILAYGAARSGADALRSWLGQTVFGAYGFVDMARDALFAAEHNAPLPPLLTVFHQLAGAAGIWWPFENAVVIADRPVNVEGAPGSGKWSMTFGDGFVGAPYQQRPKAAQRPAKGATAAILGADLPEAPAERVAFLRKHADSLPVYEQYIAGECVEAWKALGALGPRLRSTDAHAADALAVAYETMERVKANAQTLEARLRAMQYRFSSKTETVPRRMRARAIRRIEKVAGTPLPLSLRAFYEVVGSIDWMGSHPALAPARSSVTPDPLVVYGVDAALDELEQMAADDGDLALLIAPDDLHKANVSGGDPYTIELPAPPADAPIELGCEGEELLFVDYLRLAFEWGGFPGWRHADAIVPPEIDSLRAGLVRF